MTKTSKAILQGIARAVEITSAPQVARVRRPAPKLAQINPRLDALRMRNQAISKTLQSTLPNV